MKNFKIFIITGLSGSGKSNAIAAFEDLGFYCVDNMPVELMPKFIELPIETMSEIAGFAFVMDLREKGFLSKYTSIFESLKKNGFNLEILFLEADEDILLRRYSQTRRQHPLSKKKNYSDGGLLTAIRAEKLQLQELRTISDRVVDTSNFNVHQLKAVIRQIAQKGIKTAQMRIQILSFGFKYGIPQEADLIIDVRFLRNPYFIPDLKSLTGVTEEVRNYVLNNKKTRGFLYKYFTLLDYVLPLYEKEGKAYLTIAAGCTGGRHRSVAIAEEIHRHLKPTRHEIGLTHRDLSNDPN